MLGSSPLTLTERDSSSQFVESALNDWIESLNTEQRERFISGVWSIFESVGATEITEILRGKNTLTLLSAMSHLDDETRSVINDTLAQLRKSVKSSLLTDLRSCASVSVKSSLLTAMNKKIPSESK